MRFSPSLVSYERCRSRPVTIARMPRVMDSATFSAAWRHTLTVRNRLSPSFQAFAVLVEVAGRAGDAELGYRLPARREAQLRVVHQVAGDGQLGVVVMVSFSFMALLPLTCGSFALGDRRWRPVAGWPPPQGPPDARPEAQASNRVVKKFRARPVLSRGTKVFRFGRGLMLRGRVVAGDCRIESGRRPVLSVLAAAAALSGTRRRNVIPRRYGVSATGILPGHPGS